MTHNGTDNGTSRREFIDSAIPAAALVNILAGCGTAKAIEVRGACYHDCPDACSWIVTSKEGRAVKIEGDKNHPFTQGELCPRMNGFLEDIVYSPDRLRHPLKRVGPKGEGRFERVSWDAALAEVASRMQQIIREDGPTAILPYSYFGTEGMLQAGSIDYRLWSRLGVSRLDRNICGSAGNEGLKATIGTALGILPEDIVHSRYILLWGSNPVNTNPHLWPFIEEARRRGARLVVIDPLKTGSTEKADWHLQPLPGTDAALALGMMHVIVAESLHDADYVGQYTVGFDKLCERVKEYPPARVAKITGLSENDVVELARSYAKVRPATIRLLVGMEHRANGAMAFRTIGCLPALTGAWRERGGGLLYMTFDLFAAALIDAGMPELQDKRIRSINMVQIGKALTDTTLKPPIRALVVYNSNPATIAPNQNLVKQGLEREDLLCVVLEHFMTDTARYADYVFPSTTQVEHLDVMGSWGTRCVALNLPAAKPVGEAVPNTEFFRRLAKQLGLTDTYLYETDEQLARTVLKSSHPYMKGITYDRLLKEGWAPLSIPEPWLPFANGNFPTASKKCEFYSEQMRKMGKDPLPQYIPVGTAGKEHPLMLLTSKAAKHFLNSSHAGARGSTQAEGEPRLQMHRDDATPRGIVDGDMVRVYNQRGSLQIRAEVAARVRPQVVAMSHGWWASRMPGGSSANALTPDGVSDLGGGGDFHDAWVQVKKLC
jgi:anaerobic selenocysteine-containing dehydrogenase